MIKRKLVTFITIIVAILLQTTIFRKLALSDVVPNLLLVVTVTYSYLRGRTSGLLTGFLCGLFLDCICGSVVGLYAFVMMTIGFIIGFCQKIYFRNSLVLPLILIAAVDCIFLFTSFTGSFQRWCTLLWLGSCFTGLSYILKHGYPEKKKRRYSFARQCT